jgi:Flavin containing amine oxidoreductase
MAYNDALNVDFWGGLRPPNDANPTLVDDCKSGYRHESGDTRLRDNWKDHSAPTELVAEMHRELLEVHNLQSAPQPIQASYVDWSDDPFGAGSHVWNRGVKSWAIVEEMTQPIPDFPCYVCGEAYATIQGWVEGALETAEIVLQVRLGLPAPTWLPAR